MSNRAKPPAPPARPARAPLAPLTAAAVLALPLLLLALAGCEPDAKVNAAAEGVPVEETEAEMEVSSLDDDPDAARVPPEGGYAYTAVHPNPVTGDTMRLQGLLQLTATDDDRIEGRWDVQQLHPEWYDGEWEDGAYTVRAKTSYPGFLVHRIGMGPDRALRCDARFTWVAEGGVDRATPAECTLVPSDAVPGAQGVPAPRSIPIRDAEPPEPGRPEPAVPD